MPTYHLRINKNPNQTGLNMPQDEFINEKQEIEKQINKLKRKMRTLQTRRRRPVITSILRSMAEYEITPEEIAKEYEKRNTKAAKKTRSTPDKYKNPETGATWSGRGRPPRWITDAEEDGKSRDDFLIK